MVALFKPKFKDGELLLVAQEALDHESSVDARQLKLSCQDGVITLHGRLPSKVARQHAVTAITTAYERKHLRFDHIDDLTTS
ncbi:MAG: hypothetical protein KDD78_07090 [Caldilineaceae bacterium]|nr:hypothetical protein [Caldilineaceae bacterium]